MRRLGSPVFPLVLTGEPGLGIDAQFFNNIHPSHFSFQPFPGEIPRDEVSFIPVSVLSDTGSPLTCFLSTTTSRCGLASFISRSLASTSSQVIVKPLDVHQRLDRL